MNRVEFFNAGRELPVALDYLWLIIDGVVKSYTVSEQEKTIILGFWGKDEVVGKSLSNISPYFLQCMNDVRVVAVSSDQWNTISVNLLNKIQQTQELSYILCHNLKEDRLWLLLKWLARKFGNETLAGIEINFGLTKRELADALGIEVFLVDGILSKLEQENRIVRSGDRYTIFDRSDAN